VKAPGPNRPASVRARLLNLAKETGSDFQSTLVSYAVERLLYRLGESAYRDQLVLKGAQLFRIWMGELHRPTRDLDLLGSGSPGLEVVVAMIREVAPHPVADGITFDESTITASRIREDAEYEGVRVTLSAHLAGARIPLQVDIGFGDAVTPAAALTEYPALLGTLPPRILTYPAETVVAEKYHAMVVLDIQNSRMKDFYDVWFLARSRSFEPNELAAAIHATFERRQTALPAFPPFALTGGFLANPEKQQQWAAFLNRLVLNDRAPASLAEAGATIRRLLEECLK